MCKIDTATSFEDGKTQLEEGKYDVAILDIMGVKGFELLEIAKKEGPRPHVDSSRPYRRKS